MLDELGEGQDGGDQGVVEKFGVAGPDRPDALFAERAQHGQSVGVAPGEEGDGKPIEAGNLAPELLHEFGRAPDGRRISVFGLVLLFLRGSGQDVERDVAGEIPVGGGRLVRRPFRGPFRRDGGPIFAELIVRGERHVRQGTEDPVDGVEDDGAGAPRMDERGGFLDGRFGAGAVVLGQNAPEKPRIAAAPLVDGLLDVAHVEQRAVAVGILENFVHQVFDDGPLEQRGVLEFVEQPVAEAGVEPEIHQRPQARRRRPGGGIQQMGDVVERQLPGADNVVAAVAAVGRQQLVEAPGASDLFAEEDEADLREGAGQRGLRFGRQGNLRPADLDGIADAFWIGKGPVEAVREGVLEIEIAALAGGFQHVDETVPIVPRLAGLERVRLFREGLENGGPIGLLRRRQSVRPDAAGVAPGFGIRRTPVQRVLVSDQVADGAVDAFPLFAEGRPLEGFHPFAAFRVGLGFLSEQALQDEIFLGGRRFRRDGRIGSDAVFEAELPENLQEERIERADAQSGQRMDERAQGGLRGGPVGEPRQSAVGQLAVQLRESLFECGRLRQARQDARQDFAGGLAGEGQRDDGRRLRAAGQQGEIAAAEGERLAGAGGSRHGRAADLDGRAHAWPGSRISFSPAAKSGSKSSKGIVWSAGGQNLPARMPATTSRAWARADS